jgi:WD40 repeat protein
MLKLWDAQTGQELFNLKHAGIGVAFSPDGKRLASGLKVWDVQTGKELLALPGGSTGLSLVFSPDGKRLASTRRRQLQGQEIEVQMWDAETGKELLSFKDTLALIAFSPDGKRLAGSGGGRVKVWDAQTGQELLTLKRHPAHFQGIIGFSPDGHRLAGTTSDDTVKIYDATPLPEAGVK